MPFLESGNVRYLAFELLTDAGAPHAVFTRRGGVSPAPWASLNLGGTVGDSPERAAKNQHKALASVGRPVETVFDVCQVHGNRVVRVDAPLNGSSPQADGMITNRTGVTLLMRFADCVPIMLYDPVHKAAGLVHAGWQGTVLRAARETVLAMQAEYGTHPADLLAAIGPSIDAHHYPVGEQVAGQVRQAFGMDAAGLLVETKTDTMNDGTQVDASSSEQTSTAIHFDLWAANRLILEHSGVRNIEVAGLCTACHLEDWYSHRAEKGSTGRFGACIWLAD